MDQASQNLLDCQDEHDFTDQETFQYSQDITQYQDSSPSKWDSSKNNNFLLTFSNKPHLTSPKQHHSQSVDNSLFSPSFKSSHEQLSYSCPNDSSPSKTSYKTPRQGFRRNLSMRLSESDISIESSNLLLSTGKLVNKVSENVLISKSKVSLGWLAENRIVAGGDTGESMQRQKLFLQQSIPIQSGQIAKLTISPDGKIVKEDLYIPTMGTPLISFKYDQFKDNQPKIIGWNTMKGSVRKKKKIVVFPSNPFDARRNSSSNPSIVSPRIKNTMTATTTTIEPQITFNEMLQIAQRTCKQMNRSQYPFDKDLSKSIDFSTLENNNSMKIRPQRTLVSKKKTTESTSFYKSLPLPKNPPRLFEVNKISINPQFSPIQTRKNHLNVTSEVEKVSDPIQRRYLPRTIRQGGSERFPRQHNLACESFYETSQLHTISLPY